MADGYEDYGDPYWGGGNAPGDVPSINWINTESDYGPGETPGPANEAPYSNEGRQYGGDPNIQALDPTASGPFANIQSPNFASWLKGLGGKAFDFATSKNGLAALLALYMANQAKKDAQRTETGGGIGKAYAGYTPLTRTITQGRYGPLAQYAAGGGVMHAYANGGKVQMEDGGFVMTKRAVDGAGGPRGIAQLVPGARMIRGPGTGTSDSIPAQINGPHGVTPARVSNGEMYVPRQAAAQAGGIPALYAMMNKLQRKA